MIELIYFISGFGIAKILSGSSVGKSGILPSLIFKKTHIHHWIWSSILALLFLTFGNTIWIFFFGITIQGLSYADHFNFSSSR